LGEPLANGALVPARIRIVERQLVAPSFFRLEPPAKAFFEPFDNAAAPARRNQLVARPPPYRLELRAAAAFLRERRIDRAQVRVVQAQLHCRTRSGRRREGGAAPPVSVAQPFDFRNAFFEDATACGKLPLLFSLDALAPVE
jgi:hypothetical protein